jgi:hypothetical protein
VSHQVPEFDLSEPSLGDEENEATVREAAPAARQVPQHAPPAPAPVTAPVAAPAQGKAWPAAATIASGQAERPAPPTEVITHAQRAAAQRGPAPRRRGPLVLGLTLCGLTLCGAPLVYLLAQRRAETGLPVTRAPLPKAGAVVAERAAAPEEDPSSAQSDEAETASEGQDRQPGRSVRPVRARLARRHHGIVPVPGPGGQGGPALSVLSHRGLQPVSRLTPEQLRAVMVRSQPQLHGCLQEGWGSDVTIGVTVRPTGQVERVEIMNALSGRPTGRCLEGRIRALRFPPFAEGENKQFFWLYHMPAPGEG